jgi:hypothetical protein
MTWVVASMGTVGGAIEDRVPGDHRRRPDASGVGGIVSGARDYVACCESRGRSRVAYRSDAAVV